MPVSGIKESKSNLFSLFRVAILDTAKSAMMWVFYIQTSPINRKWSGQSEDC